ncbi:MAG: DNA mismatch repair endonuclease MutL [Endomicrobiaceae bacterium]|nr:DNA mismatch repair endonuclease MutL [Endomicrobiaceae bacterium]
MTIEILDENTINKISAGEVVERPLNVVKELVENALDAKATSISVEIEKAGKKLIRVCDNGCGMDKEDLQLSIKRHATNKIKTFEDLANIVSLGFRGEALPSIASISMFDIKTQQQEKSSGWQLSIEGNKVSNLQPWAGSGGTIAEVRNLFFNTPVREKFLKTDTTEKSKIISCIDEIALVKNDINFKVICDNKTISDYQKTDSKIKRIEDVLGKDMSKKLKHIFFSHQKVEIDAFITTRENSLAQKKLQYLFVNGRCVNYPKWLIHSVYQAYKQAIPIGRYPGIIMFLKTNPADIDINVHPTKREIKFAKENEMYELFYSFIKGSVESDAPSNVINLQIQEEPYINRDYKTNYSFGKSYSKPYGKPFSSPKDVTVEDYKNLYSTTRHTVGQQTEIIHADNCKFVGQVFTTYILVEKDDTFYIIDQHAAQERVRYEMFSNQISKKSLNIQQFLIPEVFELSSPKAIILKSQLETFNKLGFSVEEFGDNTFRLTSYPALLGFKINFIEIIDVLLEFLADEKTTDIERINETIIRTACRSSIKAGDKLQDIQAIELMKDLFACHMPWTCPHGRPTVYTLTQADLEKFFKRT